MSPSLISAVPRQYRGPGRASRRIPAAARVLARARVVLFDALSDLARSLSAMPSCGPSATILISRIALATLRTVYRSVWPLSADGSSPGACGPSAGSAAVPPARAAPTRPHLRGKLFGIAERYV